MLVATKHEGCPQGFFMESTVAPAPTCTTEISRARAKARVCRIVSEKGRAVLRTLIAKIHKFRVLEGPLSSPAERCFK